MEHSEPPATTRGYESLRDAVVGVTGAAHGIGEATAMHLGALGAHIIAIDRDGQRLAAVRDRFHASHGERMLAIDCDVEDADAVQQAITAAVGRWGRIDGWVNSAAITVWGEQASISEDDFARTWRINCLAAWRIIRLIVPHVPARGGAVVNVSTVMTQLDAPGNSAYSSSKGALEAMTRTLALELAPRRIRVNCVRPGFIDSNHQEAQRSPDDAAERFYTRAQPWPEPGRPAVVASAIAFLLSDAARFTTGAALDVDGGLSVRLRWPADELSTAAP